MGRGILKIIDNLQALSLLARNSGAMGVEIIYFVKILQVHENPIYCCLE
jgi:hypothetical protein